MSTIVAKQSQMELVYEGSVKRVWKKVNSDSLFFEFTDDYSVFDWGKMPDTIEHKGRSLAILGTYFFEKLADPTFWQGLKNNTGLQKIKKEWLEKRFDNELHKQLCKSGAANHFRGLVKESGEHLDLPGAVDALQTPLIEVAGAQVIQPEAVTVCGQSVYHYPAVSGVGGSRRLVPLEVIFRFGIPSGSSLQSRLKKDPDYAETIGLAGVPKPNEMFPYPIFEFFTKLEPSDRILTVQEALLISQLSADQFKYLVELTRNLAMGLYAIFAECGVELWDGKFEFILDGETIALADSIGPDELRLLYKGKHLSKEMLRQVYRGGTWEQATKAAKLAARGGGWKKICKEQPKRLPADIKKSIDSLYPMLANVVTGKELFSGQPNLDQFIESLPTLEVKL